MTPEPQHLEVIQPSRNTEAPNHPIFHLLSPIFYLLVPLALFWALLIYNLGAQWSIYEQYNYGWAVPFLCVYLLYRRLNNPGPRSDVRSQSSEPRGQTAEATLKAESRKQKGEIPATQDFSISAFSREPCCAPSSGLAASKQSEDGGKGQGEGGISAFQHFSISAFSQVLSSLSSLVPWSLALCCLAYAPTRWLHEANPTWRLTSWLWSLEVIAITLLTLKLGESKKQKVEISASQHFCISAFSREPCSAPSPGLAASKQSEDGGEGQGEGGISAFQRFRISAFSQVLSSLSPLVPWSFGLIFPFAFFLVAVPWPSALEGFFVHSLTSLDISATSELLGLFGIPAVQHGNTLEISSGMVGVDEACSGIRSFQATLMLSLFFGEFYRLTPLRRALCVLAGFVFSMLFNIGRTLLLVYVGSSRGIGAISKWHDPAGTTILVLCFLCLWLLARFLRSKTSYSAFQNVSVSAFASAPTSDLGPLTSDLRPPTSDFPAPSRTPLSASEGEGQGEVALHPTSDLRPPTSGFPSLSPLVPWSFGPFILLFWVLAVEAGTEGWYRWHETSVAKNFVWSVQTAPTIPGFERQPISKSVSEQFMADESIQARWQDSSGHPWQLYYFRWPPSHSLKKRVATRLAKTHGPEKCLPRSGMTLKQYMGVITLPIGVPFGSQSPNSNLQSSTFASGPQSPNSNLASPVFKLAFQHYIFTVENQQVQVFYGIYEDQSGPEFLANRRRETRSRIEAAFAGSRNYGQRFLETAVWGYDTPEAAREALQRELGKLIKVD